MEALVIDEGSKGIVERQLKSIAVNVDAVRAAIAELRSLLPDDPDPADGIRRRWHLDEVELVLEISGEGGVKLLGSATVGVTGGIKILYKRRD